MQFSIFKNQLSSWQGKSLIVGLNKSEIDSQLKKIDFIVELKEITKKFNYNNFNGETGSSISLDILGHNLESLTVIGLGDKNKMNSDVLRNCLSESIRKLADKEERIAILMPWEALENLSLIHI